MLLKKIFRFIFVIEYTGCLTVDGRLEIRGKWDSFEKKIYSYGITLIRFDNDVEATRILSVYKNKVNQKRNIIVFG